MRNAKKSALVLVFFAILALAAWLRIEAAMHTVVEVPIRADARDYVAYSYNMLHSSTYSRQVAWPVVKRHVTPVSDAMRQPGYPAFLTLFLRGEPDQKFVDAVVLSQACIGICIVALVFCLARLMFGAAAGLGAMLFAALSPHLIVMEGYVLSETLFALSVLATLGALLLMCRPPDVAKRLKWAAATGVLLALSCYVRPTLEHLAPLMFLVVWLVPGLKPYRREASVIAIVFALTMAPWWVRNLNVIGHLSDPTLMISTLHHGSYPDFIYPGNADSAGYPYEYDPLTPQIESSLASVLGYIFHKFTEQPLTYLHWYLIGKIQFFLDWDIVDGAYDVFTYPVLQSPYYSDMVFITTHAIMRGMHWPLAIAGVIGALLAWTPFVIPVFSGWRLGAVRVMSCMMLYVLLVHIAGAPYPRYSIPFRPLQYLLAMFAIVLACRAAGRYRRQRPRRERT
jgi:4-amino-4-deoxy-L-arabinose transferase-like glycosyltransferase